MADTETGVTMPQSAKLHIVAAGASTAPMSAPDAEPSSLQQAQVHAAAVARLLQEVEKLRHTEAKLATDQLAAIERETREIAELNAKAEERVQAIANAHIEDDRVFLAERNSRAVAEARARVLVRQRIAEERRLKSLAEECAMVVAEAARLALQRGDAEATAIRRESERRDAEQNLAAAALRRLELNSAAAAVAEANLRVEREALEASRERLAAEKREHDALAKKLEFDKCAAHEALQLANTEAKLAVQAKRRADADAAAAASLAARIAAEHEAAELAQQQAVAEAELASASTARRDERRARMEAVASRVQAEVDHADAANEEQQVADDHEAAGQKSVAEPAYARSAMQRGWGGRLRRLGLGFSAIAVTASLSVPLYFWHQDVEQIAGRVSVASNVRGVIAPISLASNPETFEQLESGLPGMKMSERLSGTP
jgi:hypothetical protein